MSPKTLSHLNAACVVSAVLLSSLGAQQPPPDPKDPKQVQSIEVAPKDEKTVGFATVNPGDVYKLDVTPLAFYRFKTDGDDDILGENTDAALLHDDALWKRTINEDDHKQFKVTSGNIHEGHEAVFRLRFKQPQASGGGGQSTPLDNAYVKAVNCFVKIHTPGSIAAPGVLIPAPTQPGKPYTGILQPNTDDEIITGNEDWMGFAKTGDGLTKDNDLVKVELSWNPYALRPEMVEGKKLMLALPAKTKAFLPSGQLLIDKEVVIGSPGGQLAPLGGSARKQVIFIEADSGYTGGEIVLYVDGLDKPGANGRAMLSPADLAIHNGLAAPNSVPEKDEEKIGAFTVANLNDTDGDGMIDNDIGETSVKRITDGADEEDLMRLVIKGPDQGRMKLTVVSGQVSLWEQSTKEIRIDTPGNPVFIDCADLPKTIWVEATSHSTNLQDIEMKLGWETPDAQLCDNLDIVKATAVWAEKTDAKFTNGDALWVEADNPLKDTFINYLGSVFGSNMNAPFGETHFSIGIEFTVKPNGIATMPGVAFDITRDKAFRDWSVNGGGVTANFTSGQDDVFDKGDVSDDDGLGEPDEDVIPQTTPPSDKIFSIDGPGERFVLHDQVISRNHFEEFVRVSFDGSRPRGENADGSRCSPNVKWHAFYWMEKDPATNNKKYRMRAGKDNVVGLLHPLTLGTTPSP
jgi:hypothetical protein